MCAVSDNFLKKLSINNENNIIFLAFFTQILVESP